MTFFLKTQRLNRNKGENHKSFQNRCAAFLSGKKPQHLAILLSFGLLWTFAVIINGKNSIGAQAQVSQNTIEGEGLPVSISVNQTKSCLLFNAEAKKKRN